MGWTFEPLRGGREGMFGLLTTALGLGGKLLSHVLGGHVVGALASKTAIPAANAIADGLGLRGAFGLVAGLYVGSAGFRAGVDQAIAALIP